MTGQALCCFMSEKNQLGPNQFRTICALYRLKNERRANSLEVFQPHNNEVGATLPSANYSWVTDLFRN